MSSAREKFYLATLALVGSAPIKQRLATAYQQNLVDLEHEELPEAIQSEFGQLREALHKVRPLNGEGRVPASVRKMSSHEADEFAAKIVVIYDILARDHGSTSQLPAA